MSSNDGAAAVEGWPDPDYPIVYTVVPWVRAVTVLGALVAGCLGTYTAFHPPYAHGRIVFNPILASVDVILLAGLAYGVAWALTARITLHADRFEQRKPFIHRVLGLGDIAGRRYTTGRGEGYPVIVPKQGMAFSIDSTSYGLDERFRRWFIRLPNLQ